MNDSWKNGFDAAREGSRLAKAPRHSRKVGAALYGGSRLLSIGFNEYGKTHPADRRERSLHAEHRAILRRQHFVTSGRQILYVWRETADGCAANSTPCLNCMRLIREADIKIIRYIDEYGEAKELKL